MHQLGLVAIQPRSFQPRTTDSRHTLGYSPNLGPLDQLMSDLKLMFDEKSR